MSSTLRRARLGSRRTILNRIAAATLVAAWALLLTVSAGAQVKFDPENYQKLVPTSSPDTIAPGTKITLQNWTQYRRFMPFGMQVLYGGQYSFKVGSDPGFTVEVGPTIPIALPRKVVSDTEKNSGQVRLTNADTGGKSIAGYVAGVPFPNLSATDPDLGYKVMYNNWYRYWDFVRSFSSHTRLVDRFQNIFYQLGSTTYWRLSHMSVEGMPNTVPYAQGFVVSARFSLLLPEQTKYTTEIEMIPDNPLKTPELYVYLPSLRRSLRLSSASRCSPLLGTDYVADDGTGALNSPGMFKMESLGERKILAILHEDPVARQQTETFLIKSSVPGWPTAKDGKYELRDTYVVAIYPLPALGTNYCYGVRIAYVDKQAWNIYWYDIYDSGHKFWKTEWLFTHPTEIGSGEQFITINNTSTMLDMQNSHVTTVVENGNTYEKNAPAELKDASTWAFPGSLGQIMK